MAGMTWRTTGDVAESLDVAGAYLRRERARNTVLLTVTEQLRVNRERDAAAAAGVTDPAHLPLFGWWQGPPGQGAAGHGPADQGAAGQGAAGQGPCAAIGGAFMPTPPHPLLLTAVTAGAAAGLAATLAGRPLRAVNAYQEAAQWFAAAWCEATGCRAAPLRAMRLYRLAELAWPGPAPD